MREPLPFQRDGIEFLKTHGAALLGDDMGLGKTFQTIEAIQAAPAPGPKIVLVICPKNATTVWHQELLKAGNIPSTLLKARKDVEKWKIDKRTVWAIVSFNIFRLNRTLFPIPDYLVVDEAHSIKDITTDTCEAVTPFALRSPRVYLLTGTPIKNNYSELFSLARIVVPHKRMVEFGVGNYRSWEEAFCVTEWEKVWVKRKDGPRQINVKKIVGSKNGRRMKELITPYYLRRTKKQVLPELKPLRWQPLPVTLDGKILHGLTEHDIEMAVLAAESGRPPRSKHIMAARMELATALAPAAVQTALDYVDATGLPMVIFCQHLDPLFIVEADLKQAGLRVAMIYGDTSAKDRAKYVEQFQEGELDVILGQTISAGVAITLTRASYCLFIDLCWSPMDNAQARDRLNRIGQLSDVLAQYMVVPNDSLSTRVTSILAAKTAALEEFEVA